MILEDTPESVRQAKQLLGIPVDAGIGFRRNADGVLQPYLEQGDRHWYVGDEVLPA